MSPLRLAHLFNNIASNIEVGVDIAILGARSMQHGEMHGVLESEQVSSAGFAIEPVARVTTQCPKCQLELVNPARVITEARDRHNPDQSVWITYAAESVESGHLGMLRCFIANVSASALPV